jgi:uncharacterized membrane protein
MMTRRQAFLMVIYYGLLMFVFVAIASPFLIVYGGPGVTWKGLFFTFLVQASCGPIFVALVYRARLGRDKAMTYSFRAGIVIGSIALLSELATAWGARVLRLTFISPATLVNNGYGASRWHSPLVR